MDIVAPHTVTFESTDADTIEQRLVGLYGAEMRIRGHDRRSLLRHRRITAGAIAVESAEHSADLEFRVEPLKQLVVLRSSSARIHRACGECDGRYDTGQVLMLNHPGRPHAARMMPGQIDTCLIDPHLVARVAAAAPGRRPEPIRFTSLDPRSPAAAAHWWTTRTYVADVLSNADAVAAPLMVGSAAQLLAAATLATFPNTALAEPTIEDRHDGSTRTLRRAVAFIDDNAAADLSVADIAAGANVSIRAVQLAFRRHLNTTPMACLRRVRLDLAHRELIDADPATTTVSAVAARWGFGSHSRFTTAYRQAYGVAPSTTLRGD
jgi:AraC-like DNA-binding protein